MTNKHRYIVSVTHYSLNAGSAFGKRAADPVFLSRHHSFNAARRMLGSFISGKRSTDARLSMRDCGARLTVYDQETGKHYSRAGIDLGFYP